MSCSYDDIATTDSYEEPPAESLAVLHRIFSLDNVTPILINSRNQQVEINVLRQQNMVLLFSGPDISDGNIAFLNQINNNKCTIVWIPIVYMNWNDAQKRSVRLKRSNIPGYSVECFLPMPRAITYISINWKYNDNPKLVLMDKHGDVKTTKDGSMIPTKKSDIFPFFTLLSGKGK